MQIDETMAAWLAGARCFFYEGCLVRGKSGGLTLT